MHSTIYRPVYNVLEQLQLQSSVIQYLRDAMKTQMMLMSYGRGQIKNLTLHGIRSLVHMYGMNQFIRAGEQLQGITGGSVAAKVDSGPEGKHTTTSGTLFYRP